MAHTMKKAKKPTKYVYLLVLQGNYGLHGWEDLCAVDRAEPGARKQIRAHKVEYDTNEGGDYKIITRRTLRAAA